MAHPLHNSDDILKTLFGEEKKEIPQSLIIPLKVNLIVTDVNNVPAIQLRRTVSDNDRIKVLVYCAVHELPCVIHPHFNDRLQSLAQLVNKGILYQKDGEYYFNF